MYLSNRSNRTYGTSTLAPRTTSSTPYDSAREVFATNVGWKGSDTQGTLFEIVSPQTATSTFSSSVGGPPPTFLVRVTVKGVSPLVFGPSDEAFRTVLMQAYGIFSPAKSGSTGSFVCPPDAKCASPEHGDTRFATQMRALAGTLPDSEKTTVSTTGSAGSSGMGLMDKPWFWPAVVVVGVVGFMALRDNKR
jgi:hypothetical protein